ncbi:dihydroxyacetone kinase subunit DhaL [Marinilactibacillus psychrotolerans]|uniref:dihydroxyacetone kinase subunit DhaL n=1 Tax=Marinilactibacillus psychrotolerans TaxID=191770 RepID=UPI00388A7B44
MVVTLSKDYFVESIKKIAEMIEKERNYLTKLDSDIGDGDHGINLSIGFREVTKRLSELNENTEDISSFLKKVGMTLLGKVGGASGPLYGSFFMKMGTDVKGKEVVTFEEFIKMIDNGVAAVEMRGKAQVGDKTMIDSLRPGADYLKESDPNGRELELFKEFIEVLKQGAKNTDPLIAKKGRSLRLGERAIGHRDPGAESSYLIFKAFYESFLDSDEKNIIKNGESMR